jgi:hypothetical protein
MPDTPVEPPASGRYPADMESRVAVLEQIARRPNASLERIERRFDAIDGRFEAMNRRIDSLATEHRSDFRWLLGIMLGGFGMTLGGFGAMLGVMAHGFHWL